MNKLNVCVVSALMLSACAGMKAKGPDLNMRFYRAGQKMGEQLPDLSGLKKQQDKVLLLNITPGIENGMVSVEKITEETSAEIDGKDVLNQRMLDSAEDGLVSGLVSRGVGVIGSKVTLGSVHELLEKNTPLVPITVQPEKKVVRKGLFGFLFRRKSKSSEKEEPVAQFGGSFFEPRELAYMSPRTMPALKGLTDKYPVNRILLYRILSVQKPEKRLVWNSQDWRRGWFPSAKNEYSPTRVRMYVRLMDAESGLVLYSDQVETQY